MKRVIAYIDGFNLYFGLKAAKFKRYYWLDLDVLARRLLKPGQELADTYYFTARIRDNGYNQADRKRQNDYLEALTERRVKAQYGHYLEKLRPQVRSPLDGFRGEDDRCQSRRPITHRRFRQQL